MRICVFCSANGQIDENYFRLTDQLGRWMAREGHTLIFGGVNQGLMDCVARAVHDGGGRTIGVVPRVIIQSGRLSPYIDVEIPCNDLSDRKQLMLDQSDIFVALPGGIGTIDEVFTVAASATIGYHTKRVVLYDMDGFWAPLTRMLDELQQRGVIRGRWQDYILTASTLEELKALLTC